jgi:hypothetical protein
MLFSALWRPSGARSSPGGVVGAPAVAFVDEEAGSVYVDRITGPLEAFNVGVPPKRILRHLDPAIPAVMFRGERHELNPLIAEIQHIRARATLPATPRSK